MTFALLSGFALGGTRLAAGTSTATFQAVSDENVPYSQAAARTVPTSSKVTWVVGNVHVVGSATQVKYLRARVETAPGSGLYLTWVLGETGSGDTTWRDHMAAFPVRPGCRWYIDRGNTTETFTTVREVAE